MKHLIKAEQGERSKGSIEWHLVFYDDESGDFKRIVEWENGEQDK